MPQELLTTFIPSAQVTPQQPLMLEIGTTFGPFYLNFFTSRHTLIGGFGSDPAADELTNDPAAGDLLDDDMVQVVAPPNQKLTDGLDSGELYYVINADADSIQLSESIGGSVVPLKSVDGAMVYKCGDPMNLASHLVWAWVKRALADDDGDIILDLAPTLVDEKGVGFNFRAKILIDKDDTWGLSPAVNFWDFIMEFPDGTRRRLLRDGFVIDQPATHPAL